MPDKNKSRIMCTECGSPQVIDLKTGHVCTVEEVQGGSIKVIRDGDGRAAFMLGPEAVRMLGLDATTEDRIYGGYRAFATDRKSEAERIIRSAKPTTRFVILLSEEGGN